MTCFLYQFFSTFGLLSIFCFSFKSQLLVLRQFFSISNFFEGFRLLEAFPPYACLSLSKLFLVYSSLAYSVCSELASLQAARLCIFLYKNQECCASVRDLIKDELIIGYRREKAQHPAVIWTPDQSVTRHVLYWCATTITLLQLPVLVSLTIFFYKVSPFRSVRNE